MKVFLSDKTMHLPFLDYKNAQYSFSMTDKFGGEFTIELPCIKGDGEMDFNGAILCIKAKNFKTFTSAFLTIPEECTRNKSDAGKFLRENSISLASEHEYISQLIELVPQILLLELDKIIYNDAIIESALMHFEKAILEQKIISTGVNKIKFKI